MAEQRTKAATRRVVLCVTVACLAACGDDEAASPKLGMGPSDAGRDLPVMAAPMRGEPIDGSTGQQFPDDYFSSLQEPDCCAIDFAVAAEPREVFAILRGTAPPLDSLDGIPMRYEDGVWGIAVCMPPNYEGSYYYEVYTEPATEMDSGVGGPGPEVMSSASFDPAGLFADTRINLQAPAEAHALLGAVNLFPASDACGGSDAAVHSATDGEATGSGVTDGGMGEDEDGGTDEGPGGGDPGTPGMCVEECSVDDDCLFGGFDFGKTCVAGICSSEDEGCTDDNACVAKLSEWEQTACSSDDECFAPTPTCISYMGTGYCASTDMDPYVGTPGYCAEVSMVQFTARNPGDTGDVVVCAKPNAECRSGSCLAPCASDDDCEESDPICNTGTGVCGCSSDADCSSAGDSASHCGSNGKCGCAVDDDCTAVNDDGNSTCFDGICGCKGVDSCPADYDNTTAKCALP